MDKLSIMQLYHELRNIVGEKTYPIACHDYRGRRLFHELREDNVARYTLFLHHMMKFNQFIPVSFARSVKTYSKKQLEKEFRNQSHFIVHCKNVQIFDHPEYEEKCMEMIHIIDQVNASDIRN